MSRIEILNNLAIKYSNKDNCIPVDSFEQWLLCYAPEDTIKLVHIAMEQYSRETINLLKGKQEHNKIEGPILEKDRQAYILEAFRKGKTIETLNSKGQWTKFERQNQLDMPCFDYKKATEWRVKPE